jgi:hypothetical protein
MAVIYLNIFDSQAYYVLENATLIETISGSEFEVIPIFNGSVLAYLPLLAFAWMKRQALETDCRIMLTLLESSIESTEYWFSRILDVTKLYGGYERTELAELLLSVDNVRYLAELLSKADLLEIKAMTMTSSGGRIYIGGSEVAAYMNGIISSVDAYKE